MNSIIDELRRSINLNDIDAIKTIISKDLEGICYTRAYSTERNSVDNKSLYNGNYPGQDPSGNNVLLHAISSARYEIADLFVDDAQKKLKEQDFLNFINYQYPPVENKLYYINTALTLAAKHEKYQLVEKLLNLGADPNNTDQHGFTTATVLCMQLGLVKSKDQEIFSAINSLLEKGANFDQKDNFGFCPYNFIGYDLNPEKFDLIKFLNVAPANYQTHEIYTLAEVIESLRDSNIDVAEVEKIEAIDNIATVFNTGEHCVDAAIFDSLKWASNYEVCKQICSYEEVLDKNRSLLHPNNYKKVIYKQDFLKSDEGIEMVKSLFDRIVSNKVKDHEAKDFKIMNFDPSSLPVPKDFRVAGYDQNNLSDEELIEPIQSILEETQLDPLGSVHLHD